MIKKTTLAALIVSLFSYFMNTFGCDRTFYNKSTADWTISIITTNPTKLPIPNGGTNPCVKDSCVKYKDLPLVPCIRCTLPGVSNPAVPTTATTTFNNGTGEITLKAGSYTATYIYGVQSGGFSPKNCAKIGHDGDTNYMDVNKPANGDITIFGNPDSAP